MFATGNDTTFITLDWGMTDLIMNPEAMERAQDPLSHGGSLKTKSKTAPFCGLVFNLIFFSSKRAF
jgi:hypothetical protein